MNKEVDKMLINLKILSKITEYNKIYINDEKFVVIDINNTFCNIKRFFYNINRYKNIDDLVALYNEIFMFIKQTISKFNINDDDIDDIVKNLSDISKELNNSSDGLFNLKNIYKTDILIKSKIDIILNNIERNTNCITNHLKFYHLY
jgi:translation initiation factor 2 beta subunit (eIF-2beta)/eIF-5